MLSASYDFNLGFIIYNLTPPLMQYFSMQAQIELAVMVVGSFNRYQTHKMFTLRVKVGRVKVEVGDLNLIFKNMLPYLVSSLSSLQHSA